MSKSVVTKKNNESSYNTFKNRDFEPKMRFLGFKDKWNLYKLGDFSNKSSLKNIKKEINTVFTNSSEYGLILQESFFNKDITNKENISKYFIVDENFFVYNPRISKNSPVGPINRNSLKIKGVISPLYKVFYINNTDICSTEFLDYYFSSDKWHHQIYNVSNVGARYDRMNISDKNFFDMQIYIPSMEEQNEITEFLNLVDIQIMLFENKLNILKKYHNIKRNNAMKKIEYYDESSIFQLKDICNIHKGKQLNQEDMVDDGKYPVLNGGRDFVGRFDEYTVDENTISISEGGASSGFVRYNTEKFYCGGHCYYITLKKSGINYSFLYHYLKYKEKFIMNLKTGSGIPNLNKKTLEKVEIYIPSVTEQEKIATFFNLNETLINDFVQRFKLLKKTKVYLLQNLFI